LTLLFLLLFQPLTFAEIEGEDSYKRNLNYVTDFYYLKKAGTSGQFENIGLLTFEGEYTRDNLIMHGSFMINHSTGSPSSYLSDIQVASNIDTQGGEGLKPYQAFIDYSFLSNFSMRAGLIDLSTFLNITESSMILINSSFGTSAEFGAAGRFGPAIYPIPSWGLILSHQIERLYSTFSITDPVSESELDASNMVVRPELDRHHHNIALEIGLLDGFFKKVALGFWKLRDRGENQEFQERGGYLLLDKRLGRHSAFVRLSRSSKEVDKMYQNIALGFVYQSLFMGSDSLHMGVSSVSIEGKLQKENVFELLYNKDFDHFSTSLSYQGIDNLGGLNEVGNMITLRLSLDLKDFGL